MKLPAAWMASAFVTGLFFAKSFAPMSAAAQHTTFLALLVITIVTIAAGLLLLCTRALGIAAVFSAVSWIFLGGVAMTLAQQPEPPSHVTTLLSSGKLDTSTALRWHARLREDPRRLPMGLQYDADLESVESGGDFVSVYGGMRVSYYRNEREEEPIAVRAGDRVELLVQAKLPRNYKDPGAFDRRTYLAGQNIHVLANLRHSALLMLESSPPLTLRHRLARMRGRLMKHVDSFFTDDDARAAILRAMLLGDRHFVEHQESEAFQKSGAYHVLVIAGLHVAAVVAFVLWACKRLRIPALGGTLATFAVLVLYVALVEDRPPILRAALMATIVLLARLLFRRVDILNTAAVAALILLIARPTMLSDSSFQLSFLAIGTIGAIAIPWITRFSDPYRLGLAHLQDVSRDGGLQPRVAQFRLDLRALCRAIATRVPMWLKGRSAALVTSLLRIGFIVWDLIVISLALQIGMLPLMTRDFHRVSLIGPLANIVAVPLTGLIVPIGFLSLAISFIWNALGHLLVRLTAALVAILSTAITWCSQLPHASYRIPGPPLWLAATFLVTLFALGIALRRKESPWLALAAIALVVLAATIASYPFSPRLAMGHLAVTVLDVGQGDSLFVAFPGGHTMLVDGGGTIGMGPAASMRSSFDVGEEVVSPYLWSRGLKRIDVVALTHAHQDHLGGLRTVLENFHVGALWISHEAANPALESLEALARGRGIPVVHEHEGQVFGWDGVKGEVLWPPAEDSADSPQAKNNDSLVLRLKFGSESFLLAGDIERQAEHVLAGREAPLQSDFLKIAHHGSKTSTTEEFLKRTAPRIGIISVGEANPYGHPHPDVLSRLEANGVTVLRTDRDGAVTLTSDGKSSQTTCYVPCP